MPPASTLVAFTLTTVVLVALPGPNLLYIVGNGIGYGRRAAFASAVGVETGTVVHILAAVVGVAAVLRTSAVAFATLKYVGVAYLVYLAVGAWRSSPDPAGEMEAGASSLRRAFLRGVVVNVLNPKVSLFFLAFLPQFLIPERPATVQLLVLGAVFFVIALLIDLAYATASGSIGVWLAGRPGLVRRRGQLTGGIYLALAVVASTAGSADTNG